MSDPITLAVLAGAAAGGAAGKFTEIAVGSGKLWIGKYFNNHQPKAQEKAQQNGLDFLVELGTRIKVLEDSQKVTQEKISKIQEDPDFSAALQKALISSAQTENKEKHKILAELLAQRLTVESESLLALTTKMALDVVSFLTPNQLNILGVAGLLYLVRPNNIQDQFQYEIWLKDNFKPFLNVVVNNIDLMHLESLSCLKRNTMMGRAIDDILTLRDFNIAVSPNFYKSKTGLVLQDIWFSKMENIDLTSVGALISSNVIKLKTKMIINNSLFDV
ncbi:LPO_1073/Vpar_1526 family protein [Acinetobacter zhairhuonensis]|uniref:LPO_1073/Vpar_1526 family protein n=1 Tax=Acinetobacter sp. A7.4 TaxID=2919921 RepID=UPI001F4FADE5|nr:LPO_1073/Vpar_1526 family protein [Acinetobacter sp. A7.4]MCJ8163153.1 hypothetical protein [Acinetobacter sp. A7.4]